MYNIELHLFIVCVDLNTGRKYIISKEEKDILPPTITLNKENRIKLKEHVSNFIRNIVPMHTLSVHPQIINLDSYPLVRCYQKKDIQIPEDTVNVVYGVLAEYIPLIDDTYHWVEFNYEISNNFSPIIFEVCQSLT